MVVEITTYTRPSSGVALRLEPKEIAKRGGAELFAGDACGAAWRIAGNAASATKHANMRHAKTNPADLHVAFGEARRILCGTRGIDIFLREMEIAFWSRDIVAESRGNVCVQPASQPRESR